MPKPSSAPRRSPASGPKTARQRELNTKRRGELSELAFVHKAASLGFGVAKPYGDSERFDFILVSRDWPQGDQLWRVQVKSTATLSQGFYHINAHRRTTGRVFCIPWFSAMCCNWFFTRVRICTSVCRCFNNCRRSRSSTLGTQMRGK